MLDTNDFYQMDSQRYGGSRINSAADTVKRINQKRAQQQQDLAIPAKQVSQTSAVLNGIVNEMNMKKLNDAAIAREAKYNEIMNNRSAPSGLGGDILLNRSPGSGTQNQIKNVVIRSDDPFAPSIKNMAIQDLKYSQGRGKGCTDCSAATQKWYKETTGKNIGGNTESQWKNGKTVNPSQAQNGNLVFFKSNDPKYKNRNVTHVGKYNGDGTFTHFSTNGLKTSKLDGYSLPVVGFKSY